MAVTASTHYTPIPSYAQLDEREVRDSLLTPRRPSRGVRAAWGRSTARRPGVVGEPPGTRLARPGRPAILGSRRRGLHPDPLRPARSRHVGPHGAGVRLDA